MRWSDKALIPPQPVLLTMLEIVQERTDKRRHSGPKWKFRLAPDLVVQIQPKLPNVSRSRGLTVQKQRSFEGIAYQADGAGMTTFANSKNVPHLGFVIDKDWVFSGRSTGPIQGYQEISLWRPDYPRPLSAEQMAEYQSEMRADFAVRSAALDTIVLPLRRRLLDAFEQGFFERLRPSHLLGNSCMYCGRGLTDPISQARFIGPECFGSSSVDVPWLLDLRLPERADAA